MKIEYLKIFDDKKCYKYEFASKSLIYSKDNSKGKTTLLRFILYALGYKIPATEGIGDFERFNFEIKIINEKEIIIYRKANSVKVVIGDANYDYIVPSQENELFSLIFGIDNITVLNNLLAVYYIDQEKGWTLLNRGKIIGNNRFNIEEFIAGISGININNLLDEKRVVNNEIKKYRYFKNVLDINSEFDDEVDDNVPKYESNSMDELISEQKELELELKKTENDRKKIEKILANNKSFADMIEDYGIMVSYKGEEFCLTKDNLLDFKNNQDLLRIQANNCKVKENKIKEKLGLILRTINEKNSLFSMDDILDNMEKVIDSTGVDITQIDKIIRQLTNKRNTINNQIKDKLVFNNNQLLRFYEIINDYSIELGISEFVSNKGPRFVLTNQLKGLSGRVLAQISYIFKLSYIKNIEEIFGITLPIIIDSPRTNELSEDSTNDMLKILKRDFSNHQIIVASIYNNDIINFKEINLDNGLLSDDYIIKE